MAPSVPDGLKARAAKSNGSKRRVDDIRKRASEIFQARHGGPGSALEDWQRAEAWASADATRGASAAADTGTNPGGAHQVAFEPRTWTDTGRSGEPAQAGRSECHRGKRLSPEHEHRRDIKASFAKTPDADALSIGIRSRRRVFRGGGRFPCLRFRIDALDLHSRYSLTSQADLFRRALRQIQASATSIGAAIVDTHFHRTARRGIGHNY